MSTNLREQLHQQIDQLPDHLIEEIANFTLLITTHKQNILEYTNWQDQDWKNFSLEQFFSEEDDVEYSLEDAQEIYQP